MTEQTIPVVDLDEFRSEDPAVRQKFVEKLGEALKGFGFVAVENHGVATELIHENYALFERLFALPEQTKRKYEVPSAGRQRGYTSFGIEHAKDHAKPDLKEFWQVGREFEEGDPMRNRLPPNVWPDEIAGMRQVVMSLFDAMDRCAMSLLEAISIFLDQPADFLPNMAQGGNSVTRIIYYPVCDGFDEPGAMRAAEHEDINLITLLPEATQSGLEILTRDGEWLGVPSLPGQMIVDTGDMMSRITNGRLPATTHRVVNPQGEATDRYSMPFFVHPHPDQVLRVLDNCLADGEEPKDPPITADEFLQQRLREIGVS